MREPEVSDAANKDFGSWLEAVRKQKGLSARAVSRSIGRTSGKDLAKIEQGKVKPNSSTLDKLSIALDVGLWEVYARAGHVNFLKYLPALARVDVQTAVTLGVALYPIDGEGPRSVGWALTLSMKRPGFGPSISPNPPKLLSMALDASVDEKLSPESRRSVSALCVRCWLRENYPEHTATAENAPLDREYWAQSYDDAMTHKSAAQAQTWGRSNRGKRAAR